MKPFIIFMLISAFSRALDQIIVWGRARQSWLPQGVFGWALPYPSIADAIHVYMGLKLICFGLAFFHFPEQWRNPYLKYYTEKDFRRAILKRWILIALVIFIYYQVFNLFFHVILIKPEFWRWPLG